MIAGCFQAPSFPRGAGFHPHQAVGKRWPCLQFSPQTPLCHDPLKRPESEITEGKMRSSSKNTSCLEALGCNSPSGSSAGHHAAGADRHRDPGDNAGLVFQTESCGLEEDQHVRAG